MAKSNKPSPTDMARRIWLAGIGAYGRAFDEAQGSIAKVTMDTSRVFDELVSKGEEIENTIEAKGQDMANKLKPANLNMDERIQQMRERLGLVQDAPQAASAPSELEARLDTLEAKMDEIIALLSKPTPTRKGTVAKKTTATAKKAAKKTR